MSDERIGETMGLLSGGGIEALILNTYDSPRREKFLRAIQFSGVAA